MGKCQTDPPHQRSLYAPAWPVLPSVLPAVLPIWPPMWALCCPWVVAEHLDLAQKLSIRTWKL